MRRVSGSAAIEEVSTRSCPGCNCSPTLMATSASLSSLTGSMVAETPRECVVMILPAVIVGSGPYIDRRRWPFHRDRPSVAIDRSGSAVERAELRHRRLDLLADPGLEVAQLAALRFCRRRHQPIAQPALGAHAERRDQPAIGKRVGGQQLPGE